MPWMLLRLTEPAAGSGRAGARGRSGARYPRPVPLLDAYRGLPVWRLVVYVVCLLAVVALTVIDIVWKGVQYTTIAVLVLLVVLILVRPGGLHGPRG